MSHPRSESPFLLYSNRSDSLNVLICKIGPFHPLHGKPHSMAPKQEGDRHRAAQSRAAFQASRPLPQCPLPGLLWTVEMLSIQLPTQASCLAVGHQQILHTRLLYKHSHSSQQALPAHRMPSHGLLDLA